MAAAVGVLERVVDQIVDHGTESRFVGSNEGPGSCRASNRLSLQLSAVRKPVDVFRNEGGKIHVRELRALESLGRGELQQGTNDVAHAIDVPQCGFEHRADARGNVRTLKGELDLPPYRCQRSNQLVRGVGRESTFPQERRLNASEKLIHRLGQ